MSVFSCDYDGFPFLTNALSPALSTDDTLLIMCWAKMPASSFGAARQFLVLSQDNTPGNPQMQLGVAATNHLQFKFKSGTLTAVDENTNSSIQATAADTWTHFAGVLEGPQNGTSKTFRSYVNGSLWDSGTYTSGTSSSFDTVFVGAGLDITGDPDDKYAYFAVASVASLTAAATIITSVQTLKDPKTISGVDHCWPLLDGYGADVGGNTLSFYGSIAFDAADMPQPAGTAMFTTQGFF